MSQVSSASSFSSAGTSQKTSYNKHLPRSFLLNYGRALQELNEEEEHIREGLNAAGVLFMVCLHLLVALNLMRNQEFMVKAHWTPANQSFKEDPTPRRMCNFVLDSITKKRRLVPGVSIWDAAEEDVEDSCRGRSRARGSTNTRRSLPSSWDDQPDTGREDSPQPAPKGTSHPKQSRTADWTAEPEGQDQPQQPC